MQPKWHEAAAAEIGVAETAGKDHTARIVEYHQSTSLKATDDETSWCAAFVNWCLAQAGVQGTNSASARSFLAWGKELKAPTLGCIVVLWRGAKSGWQGHVAFYAGQAKDGRILLLGGNQGNRVSIQAYPADRVLGYRWPAGVPLPTDVQPLRTSQVVQGSTASAATGAAIAAASVSDLVGQLGEADRHIQAGTILGLVAGALVIGFGIYTLISRIRAARPAAAP